MHTMHMHIGAISWLVYGSCVCTGDNPLGAACELSSHTYTDAFVYWLFERENRNDKEYTLNCPFEKRNNDIQSSNDLNIDMRYTRFLDF